MAWVRGFFEVDLDQVELPDIDPNWRYNQHGRPREEMEKWIENLKEIQSLLREGYDREDFLRMAFSTDLKERSIAESFRHFYEPDPYQGVRLVWNPERKLLEVENGVHRVWLAKQKGLRHMPAYVSAPDEGTLELIRKRGLQVAGPERIRSYADWVPGWQRQRPFPDEPDRQKPWRER